MNKNKNCLSRFHMCVQVHDNTIEPCLLVILLILTVYLNVLSVNHFIQHYMSKEAFRFAILKTC